MNVALFANLKKKPSFDLAKEILAFLKQRNVPVFTRDEHASELNCPPLSSIDSDAINFTLSLGGDGTILRLIHNYPELKAPILGINLGHLGFMAELPLSEVFEGLEELLAGAFRIEERIMMEAAIDNGPHFFAANETVVHRGSNLSLIDLSIYVDGVYLNTFSSDGIIIATPSGSTAYSLAAGGPILTPELKAFCITPISAHTISNRPIVLMPNDKIEVEYLSPYNPVDVTYDGYHYSNLETKQKLQLFKSTRTLKMVTLKRSDYYATLRTKLGWAGQLRYSQLNHRASDRD